MTTQIQNKILAAGKKRYHETLANHMNAQEAFEAVVSNLRDIFPNADPQELLEDSQRIFEGSDGNYKTALDYMCFMIEFRRAK